MKIILKHLPKLAIAGLVFAFFSCTDPNAVKDAVSDHANKDKLLKLNLADDIRDGKFENKVDIDEDGIANDLDDDMDGDGIANEEDADIDGDGIRNELDSTPYGDKPPVDGDIKPPVEEKPPVDSSTIDSDGDGIPDIIDGDKNDDAIIDNIPPVNGGDIDNSLPENSNDGDGDGISNEDDLDMDGDGIPNAIDGDANDDAILDNIPPVDGGDIDNTLPVNPNDTDGDGIANEDDADIDNDGIPNEVDLDSDDDGIRD